MPRFSVVAVRSSLPDCRRGLLGGVRFERNADFQAGRRWSYTLQYPAALTSRQQHSRERGTVSPENHPAKRRQRYRSLSAQTKSLCQEGLWKYAPLHALQPHCLRRRQRLERGGGGSWPLVCPTQTGRRRDTRRAPGTRARPSASAAGQLANAAVPRDSVSAAPPHGATVASLLPSSARSSRRPRERREICLNSLSE